MDVVLQWATAAFRENPIYWTGIVLWLLGFGVYVPCWLSSRSRPDLTRLAEVLCWLGLLITAATYFDPRVASLTPPSDWPAFDAAFWRSTRGVIWLLWIVGALALIASWIGWLTHRARWLGLCAGMTGVIASWPREEETQRIILISGVAVVVLLALVSLKRRELWRNRSDPGDYEAELVRLCNGSKRTARRLIREELRRSPQLTRPGAALAAVTRLRHERDPYPPRL